MTSAAAPTSWTTRGLLAWMSGAFEKKGLESARLRAELLLAHVLGCDRLRLYMDADRPATALERETLRSLVTRALNHEPVQYLVGEAWFFSLPFHVDKRVLVPRPSTETIVEHVIQHARVEPGFDAPVIADVCTGSGCIAVTLAKNMKGARVAATDVSAEALEVARTNAQRHRVTDRVEFLHGNMLTPLLEHPIGAELHYLVSNPPYVPDREWNDPLMMGKNVKGHEPELALRGGADGLQFVRPLIEHGPARLRRGGLLLVEIASSTADVVRELACAHSMLSGARIVQDVEGLPRVLVARRA